MRAYQLDRRPGSRCARVRAWQVRRVGAAIAPLVGMLALGAPSPALAVLSGSGTPALVEGSALSAAGSGRCAKVNLWTIDVTGFGTYYFVQAGGGWVSSFNQDGSSPFGTVSLSVSGSSFSAVNPYLNGQYTAVFHGTLARNCTIGTSTPLGTWSAHGSINNSGTFSAQGSLPQVRYEVSGTVTYQGGGGPAADVGLQADCSGGGSTTTDTTGAYSFLLPEGPCKISVVPPSGDVSTPRSIRVDVTHDMSNVNFQVSCGDGGQAGGASRGELTLDDAHPASTIGTGSPVIAPSPCALAVEVHALQPVRSGLARDDDYPQNGKVNFTANTYSAAGSAFGEPGAVVQKCEGGCANLLVTVTDKDTGRAAADATVTASVDAIQPSSAYVSQEFPFGGGDFLCTQTDDPDSEQCGSDLSGLSTDSNGQVRLIYWAPGLTSEGSAKVQVTAAETCNGDVCPAHLKKGNGDTTLTVKPYVVYEHDGELSEKGVEALVDLVQVSPFFLENEAAKAGFEKTLESSLEWLLEQEEFEEAAVAAQTAAGVFAEPIFGLIEAAHSTIEWNEEHDYLAMFLQAMDLRGTGLDDPAFESPDPAPALDPEFSQLIIHGAANPLHALAGGMLWDFAEDLSAEARIRASHHSTVPLGPASVTVRIYDVSHCNQRDPECGPGYSHATPGILPLLKLEVAMELHSADSAIGWTHSIVISQYDAIAFTESQPNLLP